MKLWMEHNSKTDPVPNVAALVMNGHYSCSHVVRNHLRTAVMTDLCNLLLSFARFQMNRVDVRQDDWRCLCCYCHRLWLVVNQLMRLPMMLELKTEEKLWLV